MLINLQIDEGVEPSLILKSVAKMTGVKSMAVLKRDSAYYEAHCNNIARIICHHGPKCNDAIKLYLDSVSAEEKRDEPGRGDVLPKRTSPTSSEDNLP